MKIRRLAGVAVLLVCFLIGGSGAQNPPPTKVMSYIAVMDLRVGKGVDPDMVVPLTNVLIDELVRMKKYTVIDRANRDKILGEVGFQMTGCADASCTVEAGRLLGVGKIVVGSIDIIGGTYLINLQLINVQTAAIENTTRSTCKNCEVDSLIENIAGAARTLMGEQAGTQPVQPAPPSRAPVPPASSVGEMILIPAGYFMMGCNDAIDTHCDPNEKPYHKVYMDAYQIDKYEVTVEQYKKCISAGKCPKPSRLALTGSCNLNESGRDNHPVNCIAWDEAKAYCEWAGKRLPTEAEWEKAARGTDGRLFPWGNDTANCRLAVMDEGGPGCGKGSTWPVGSKPSGASPYGVMDMAGNVWEWTSDMYDEKYYINSAERNPQGAESGVNRVLRGGGWPYDAASLRTSRRHWSTPDQHSSRRGTRCAKTQ